jgi:hypothetical protein
MSKELKYLVKKILVVDKDQQAREKSAGLSKINISLIMDFTYLVFLSFAIGMPH